MGRHAWPTDASVPRTIPLALSVKLVRSFLFEWQRSSSSAVASNTGWSFPFTFMNVTYTSCAVINGQSLCVARGSGLNGQFPVSMVGCGGKSERETREHSIDVTRSPAMSKQSVCQSWNMPEYPQWIISMHQLRVGFQWLFL